MTCPEKKNFIYLPFLDTNEQLIAFENFYSEISSLSPFAGARVTEQHSITRRRCLYSRTRSHPTTIWPISFLLVLQQTSFLKHTWLRLGWAQCTCLHGKIEEKKKKYENCLFQNSSLRSREKSQGKTKLELNGMGIISIKQGMYMLSPLWSLWLSGSAALQASLSLEFFRQEYWSQLPFSTPGDFPSHGSNLCFWCLLHWLMDSLPLSHLGK